MSKEGFVNPSPVFDFLTRRDHDIFHRKPSGVSGKICRRTEVSAWRKKLQYSGRKTHGLMDKSRALIRR